MKVVAQSAGGYLIDATIYEIQMFAGYRNITEMPGYIGGAYGNSAMRIGTEIPVLKVHEYFVKLRHHQDRLRESAGVLRALAQMVEAGLPDAIIPPEPPMETAQ